MAVSGRKRFDDDKVVRYETAEKDFEVEVSRTLNKWCVTVYQQPDRQILVQDFFPERWKALARAQDFIRLLNQRKKKEEEGLNSNDDDYNPSVLAAGPNPRTPSSSGLKISALGTGPLLREGRVAVTSSPTV